MDIPGPITVPALPPYSAIRSQLAAPSGGGGGGGEVVPILSAIPIVGGLLGAIFGSTPQPLPPTATNTTISLFRALFPDQNQPICGADIRCDNLNGGIPTTLNIPCDDPQQGMLSRSGIEWLIKNVGIEALLRLIARFMTARAPLVAAPGGSTGGGAGVSITNVVNVTDQSAQDAVQSVASAVTQGIAAATTAATSQADAVSKEITSNLDTTAALLSDFTGAFTTQIPAFFSKLVTGLLSPFDSIQTSISGDIAAVGGLLSEIETSVLLPIGGLITSSVAGLGGIEQTISTQLGTLGGDIGQLLTGFLPGVTDGLNNIEKVLERLGTIWTQVKDNIHFETISTDLKHLGDAIAGIAGKEISTVFRPIDLINETCDIAKFDEEISRSKGTVDGLSSPFKVLADIGMYVFLQAARMLATVEAVKRQGEESINRECPISKIDPGTVVSLWRRGILNEESAKHELLVQGYNPDRTKALYDGTAFLEDPRTALDYWYRGIASDGDLRGLLLSNGFSLAQIDAAKTASVNLRIPADALRGWLYGILDETEVNKVLRVNRFDDAQAELIKQIARRPPTAEEMLAGENNRSVLGAFSLPSLLGLGTDWDSVPQWYQDAGKAEGLDDQAIQQRWWAHWSIPDPTTVIQEYFRGLRTLGEVQAIMDRYFIPRTLQLDLIAVNRPLIPLRSVGSMLVNGVLNKDEARHVLEQHGMDDTSIDKMIHYALLAKPKASTAVATAAHATSIATSRTLFEDGTITAAQYEQVLAEHGLSQSAIDAELQVAQLQQTVKHRKQAGDDIVNEFQAGLLTMDAAKQQLAQLGMTIGEQAGYAKKLRAAKTAAAKIPGEGDLNHFLQLSIITSDQYTAALEASGYSAEWANAFLQWRIHPGTQSPAVPAAPQPTP